MSRFAFIAASPSLSRSGATSDARPFTPSLAPQQAPASTVEITGTVVQIKTFNGGWAIGSIIDSSGKLFPIKGETVGDLQMNMDYRVIGTMVNHAKYGTSLDVISAAPHVQPDERSIKRYLVDNFKGIGPKSADKMIQKILDEEGPSGLESFRMKMLEEPWSIDWTHLGREGVFEGEDDEGPGYVARDLATRIASIQGVNRSVLRSLATWLYKERAALPEDKRTKNPVFDAWKMLSEDPYQPIRSVSGYGFSTADAIGTMVSIDKNAPQRLRALIHHALDEKCNSEGHTFLNFDQLKAAMASLDPRANLDSAINHGVKNGLVFVSRVDNKSHYYTPKLYDAEVSVAADFQELMHTATPILKGELTDEQIQLAFRAGKENAAKYSLDPSQVKAVRDMLTNPGRLHILTGGPGCGKTALIETIIRLASKSTFTFCAPTGKAAKVLTSRIHMTGHSAGTIHSTFQGSEHGWLVNREDPLDTDILVVDESSMPPLEIWKVILEGMGPHTHLIMVGDPDQLPSIEAGCVLIDLLKVPGVNHVHLNQVHRNSGGILDVVHEVRLGKLNVVDRDSVLFSHGLDEPFEDFQVVVDAYLRAVARTGVENTQMLMSRRKGKEDTPGWNTTFANAVLRDILNPHATRIPGSKFHIGDRIIIRKNMMVPQRERNGEVQKAPPANRVESDLDVDAAKEDGVISERVVNGDTGSIMSFDLSRSSKGESVEWLRLKLDDGLAVDYPADKMSMLQHSYALTVHSAQGSEYREIIAVVTPGMPGFVNRNMLMTLLSRARDKLEIFGDDATLRKIAATPLPIRNSMLVSRVVGDFEDDCGDDEVVMEPVRKAPRFSYG